MFNSTHCLTGIPKMVVILKVMVMPSENLRLFSKQQKVVHLEMMIDEADSFF